MATFVVVPQWQGSSSSRAMQLIDGAEAIRGDLPASATRMVEVPFGAGESLDTGILRFSSILSVRERQTDALAATTDTVITIGGGCGIEVASIDHAASRADGEVALLWFDAHPDLNTPEQSPSGAYDGMVLRSVIGDGHPSLAASTPIASERVILAGARSIDDAENELITNSALTLITPAALSPESVLEHLRRSGASSVYIHIDLDVLDPADIAGTHWAEPFGVPAGKLVELITAVRSEYRLAGAGITGFAPATPAAASDDLGTILRIVGALAR